MSLTKCRECGNQVSTRAESCPKCGAVQKNRIGCLGYVSIIFGILVIIGVFRSTTNYTSKTTQPKDNSKRTSTISKKEIQKVYKEGDTLSIGYTSYAVRQSWWSSKSSDNPFLDQKPDAMFLFVKLTVRNDDKKPRSIPPFKLIDENGAEYETSSRGWATEGQKPDAMFERKDLFVKLTVRNDDKKPRSIPPFKLIDENGAEYETSSRGWATEGGINILESLNPSVKKDGLIVFDVPVNRKYKLKVSGGYWSGENALIELDPKQTR